MDEDALFAFGTVLAALGGVLERKGVCTTHELAETLGGVAVMPPRLAKNMPGAPNTSEAGRIWCALPPSVPAARNSVPIGSRWYAG